MQHEDGRRKGWEDGKGGEHEGLGRLNWRKDREGDQGKRFLDKSIHYRVREKTITREIPRNPRT